MKYLAFLLLFPIVAACPKHFHYLTSDFNFAQGNLIFKHLDMDISKEGVQNVLEASSGELVTVKVSWIWGPPCPQCTVYINVFGSWAPEKEIASLFSGYKGTSESSIPISFIAPSPGEHKLRVIFAYDKEYSSDFHASNLCTMEECELRGECHVLIAEGLVNVTKPDIGAPLIRITSPVSELVSGIVESYVGSVILINATSNKPVNFSVEIDGEVVSELLPFSWNTYNMSEGKYKIVVTGTDLYGNIGSDEVVVLLSNKSMEKEILPTIWTQEIGLIKTLDINSKGMLALGTEKRVQIFDKLGRKKWESLPLFEINSVSLTPDGKYLVFSSGNTIYRLENGSVVQNFTLPGPVKIIDSSLYGIVAASKNVLYYLSEDVEWMHPMSDDINAIKATPDGNRVIAASKNVLYYLRNGTIEWTHSAPFEIKDVSMTSDGKYISFAGRDSIFCIDDKASILWNKSLPGIKGLGMSSDGSIVVAHSGPIIFAFDKKGSLMWKHLSKGSIDLISISPNGKYIVISSGKTATFLDNSKKLPWVYFVLALFLAFVCGFLFKVRKKLIPKPKKEVKEVEKGKLSIKVLNSKTKRPVKNTKILAGHLFTETDKKGNAIIETGLGEVKIVVEKERFLKKEILFSVEPESYLEILLEPERGITREAASKLGEAARFLATSMEKVSMFDSCIPIYYKTIGERIISLVEGMFHTPGLFQEDELNEFVEKALRVCKDLSEIMVDWRNIRIYKAASVLEEKTCEAKDLIEKLDDLKLPEFHSVEEKLRKTDMLITNKMEEFTILPVSNLWNISKSLVEMASQESGLKRASSLLFAEILLFYVEEMLNNKEIGERLKLAIF